MAPRLRGKDGPCRLRYMIGRRLRRRWERIRNTRLGNRPIIGSHGGLILFIVAVGKRKVGKGGWQGMREIRF